MAECPTCWVLDHPVHMQLFHKFIQSGSPVDIIVATNRAEIDAMIESNSSPLPKRHILRVKRPVGKRILPIQREIRALRRIRAVTSILKRRNITGKPIEKVVVKGAALELNAAKKAKIPRRIYITDTEVNHLAHKIALSSATEVIVTPNWRQDLDGGFIDDCKNNGIRVHRLTGELPHVYLAQPSTIRDLKEGSVPRILHRSLQGGGVHDKDELVSAEPLISDLGMEVTTVAENQVIDDPWSLGVPTLLVSKAQRGFLDQHLGGGLLFRIDSTVKGPALNNEVAAWREAVQMRRRGDGLAVGWSDCYNELQQILR